MLKTALNTLFEWMPPIFGVGFLAPVIAAFLIAFGVDAPFGQPAIYTGLVLGLSWGIFAKVTGRWL